MNVGSLFAGIGGFDLGFERAGMHTAWQVEQDAYCRAVLAQHFPAAERFEDVRDVGAHNLSPVDLICGGFPCQDLSVAGKGAGIDGARSGLWSEFARIIGELRPRYVVVENVPALTRNEWLGRVLGDLAASGYDAEWDCIPAAAVGAPHRRDRIWLVAYPGSDQLRKQPGRLGGESRPGPAVAGVNGAQGDVANSGQNGFLRDEERDGAATERQRQAPRRGDADGCLDHQRGHGAAGDGASPRAVADGSRNAVPDSEGEPERPGLRPRRSTGQRGRRLGDGGSPGEHWAVEPDVGRVADGVPARVDRLASLGNALVPQIAEWIGRQILDYEQAVTSSSNPPIEGKRFV